MSRGQFDVSTLSLNFSDFVLLNIVALDPLLSVSHSRRPFDNHSQTGTPYPGTRHSSQTPYSLREDSAVMSGPGLSHPTVYFEILD